MTVSRRIFIKIKNCLGGMSANQSEAGSYRHMPRVYPRVSHLLSNLIVLEIIPNINVRTSDVAVMARWHCPGIAPRTLTNYSLGRSFKLQPILSEYNVLANSHRDSHCSAIAGPIPLHLCRGAIQSIKSADCNLAKGVQPLGNSVPELASGQMKS